MGEEQKTRNKRMRTDPEFRDEEYKKGFTKIANKNYSLIKDKVTSAIKRSKKNIKIGVLTTEQIRELEELGYEVELHGNTIARHPIHSRAAKILAKDATLIFDTDFTTKFKYRYASAYACYKFEGYRIEDTFEYPKEDRYKITVTYLNTIISWE